VTAVVVVGYNILEEELWMLPNILPEILIQLMVCIDFAWIQEEHPPCHGRGGRLLEFLERNQLSMFHNEPWDVDSLLNVVQRFNERMSMFPMSMFPLTLSMAFR
jgi:hypothetical protein